MRGAIDPAPRITSRGPTAVGRDGATPVIEITAVRLVGGTSHEHITDLQWRSDSALPGQSTRDAIAAWLSSSPNNHAVVIDGHDRIAVAVILLADQSPYLRACADGNWTDHLLALPRF